MKSYVCKDQRGDQEGKSVESFILSALGDGFPGLPLFRPDFFTPPILWPPFSAPAYVNQCTPTVKGKGGFTTVTEPLDISYTDQQPKAQEVMDPCISQSISLIFSRGFYPTDIVPLSECWICVKRKLFHTKAVSTVISVAFNDGSNMRPTLF